MADVPDLVSCSAPGATAIEAVEQLAIAKEAWLEAARETGTRVPPPPYRPVIYQAVR